MTEALLSVRDLRARVSDRDGRAVELLTGIDFTISPGERVAMVGESGSGKSVTGRAIMRLDDSIRLEGSIRFEDRELLDLSERQMADLRGSRISMVFQDALGALDPLRTIGEHVTEPLRIRGIGRREATRRALEVLDELRVPDARRRLGAYPHEFSGGMRQRVVLAMALVGNPSLLIADEPTTALDVRVQSQVLELLETTTRERDLATLFITHDLGVVSSFADRVLVMYSGAIVEGAQTADLVASPQHPYTRGLLGASPRMTGPLEQLVALPGSAPRPEARVQGCSFAPRCALAQEGCWIVPQHRLAISPTRSIACDVVRGELTKELTDADA